MSTLRGRPGPSLSAARRPHHWLGSYAGSAPRGCSLGGLRAEPPSSPGLPLTDPAENTQHPHVCGWLTQGPKPQAAAKRADTVTSHSPEPALSPTRKAACRCIRSRAEARGAVPQRGWGGGRLPLSHDPPRHPGRARPQPDSCLSHLEATGTHLTPWWAGAPAACGSGRSGLHGPQLPSSVRNPSRLQHDRPRSSEHTSCQAPVHTSSAQPCLGLRSHPTLTHGNSS